MKKGNEKCYIKVNKNGIEYNGTQSELLTLLSLIINTFIKGDMNKESIEFAVKIGMLNSPEEKLKLLIDVIKGGDDNETN